jgi:GDP-L-fucose synthase
LTTRRALAKHLIRMEKTASILVTGGSGMVGRALLARLRQDGFEQVSAPSSKQFDLRSEDAARRMFAERQADYVFHLAGHIGGIGASIADPVGFLYDNALIGMHVIHAARQVGVKKLIFLSSSCAYPRDCAQPMTEDQLLTGPNEPTNEGYAIAKIAAMKLIEYSNRQYGTNFLTLMPCNLYGPNDHYEPERSHAVSALIYKFHHAKQKNLPLVEVWGTGASRRELLFVDDLADAMLHFMHNVDAKNIGSFVNIGLGQDISIRDLAISLRDITGFRGEIVFDRGRPDGMPLKMMDVSRAAQLGWKAKVGIPEGLRRAYDWYSANCTAEAGVR